MTADQEQCLLHTLRSIERRAREAHRRIAHGGARTGENALYRIETEAGDTLRWFEGIDRDRRRDTIFDHISGSAPS